MSQRLLLLALLLLAPSVGCRNLCMQTSMRMTSDMSVTKDVTPLREHTVVPGGCSGRKIALIDVDGVLLNANLTGLSSVGENPVEMFREKLDVIARSQCYCAVVVRINSPGGGVTASDIMRRDLEAFKARTRLPVVACLMDVGCGGAYYLATACDEIIAHPTTVTGGLGVVMNVYDMQDTLNQVNVIPRVIRIGKHVDLGSPVHTMDEEGEQILKTVGRQFHQRFQHVIVNSRNLAVGYHSGTQRLPSPVDRGGVIVEEVPEPADEDELDDFDEEEESGAAGEAGDDPKEEAEGPEEAKERKEKAKPNEDDGVDALFDGRIFSATVGMQLGLIDSIGYVDDALHVARQLGRAPDAKAVILHRWRDPARTPYSITPNVPRSDLLPISLPGLERSRLPAYLYIWQPDPTLERWGGR